MSFQKVRQADLEFVQAHAQDMSERQLADALRLSKTTVHRMRRRLGLVAVDAPGAHVPERTAPPADEAVDRAVFLRRHIRRLEARMPEATDVALAALSKEYRAALEELSEMEGAARQGAGEKRRAEVTRFDVIAGRMSERRKAAQA